MGESISATMNCLSLSTATSTALPPSSPMLSSSESASHDQRPRDRLTITSPTTFQRTSTSSSTGSTERPFTPTLRKRTSLSSMPRVSGGTPPRSPLIRRIPSNLSSTTAMTSRSSLPPSAEETQNLPPISAASVAKEHLQKEIQGHELSEDTDLVVILHDACYGHRFARPRTSKASLGTIVERPERIQATVLGVSTAYVQLGGRHAGGHFSPSSGTSTNLTQRAPFKIRKSSRAVSLISPAVTQVHGTKWMAELKAMCDGAETKLALNGKELVRPTAIPGDEEERAKLHEGDLYLCAESLNALEGALGGVCDAVDAVFDVSATKRAFVCVRPPGHHCSASYPSGFCWLNNVHVGISHASMVHGLTHAAIIDFDLHHGDGSQTITWAHNVKIGTGPKNVPIAKKTAIGYFSLHDINSYPCEWGDEEKVQNASLCIENAHGQTIWNVHLQPWKSDAEFWALYEDRYSILIDKTRAFLQNHCDKLRLSPHSPRPTGAIFISAGFDASEWESPGMQRHKVNVPTDFYARFTRDIVELANEEGLGVDGRVVSVLEGGYSDRALTSGVLSHLCGLSRSNEVTTSTELRDGLGYEMGRRLGRLSMESESEGNATSSTNVIVPVDPRWWSLPYLEHLEATVSPTAPPAPAKRPRSGAPTYTTSTQSYTAKIVSPPLNRRSSSSTYRQAASLSANSRPPTPPLPDVDWAVAAHELSKILIPSDRQIGSCKAEDLNAEATRARRVRQSGIGLTNDTPAVDTRSMQLRDKKPRMPKMKSESDDENAVSRASRRKTIAGAAISKLGALDPQTSTLSAVPNIGKAPVRRRSSAASAIVSPAENVKPRITSGAIGVAQRDRQLDGAKDRPPSSLSIRPGSSLGMIPEPPLVKKTRAPSKPKPSQVMAPKKQPVKPPVPRVSSSYSAIPEIASTPSSTDLVPPSHEGLVLVANATGQSDIDHLASGLKKMSIKLNVSPREKTKAKEAKAKSAPKQPRKSAAGRPAKKPVSDLPALINKNSTESPQKSPSDSEPVRATIQPLPGNHNSEVYQNLPPENPPKHSEKDKNATTLLTSEIPENLPSSFASPNPVTIPAPAAIPQMPATSAMLPPKVPASTSTNASPPSPSHKPPTHISPETTPPTPKRTKQDLPVFTSSSPIIFGKPSFGSATTMDQTAARGGLGSLPAHHPKPKDTSRHQPAVPALPSDTTAVNGHGSLDQPADIWGVPDTPRQQQRMG
ncbi:hypothetical protein MMC13_008005 [Lambiella insularis]|nr:hypothetical protein [Lambiella insularis]